MGDERGVERAEDEQGERMYGREAEDRAVGGGRTKSSPAAGGTLSAEEACRGAGRAGSRGAGHTLARRGRALAPSREACPPARSGPASAARSVAWTEDSDSAPHAPSKEPRLADHEQGRAGRSKPLNGAGGQRSRSDVPRRSEAEARARSTGLRRRARSDTLRRSVWAGARGQETRGASRPRWAWSSAAADLKPRGGCQEEGENAR